MNTRHFTATELGLLERTGFTIVHPTQADLESEGLYVQIVKMSSDKFELVKSADDLPISLTKYFNTLRELINEGL